MIWLASTSPRRKKILRDLGVSFRVVKPSYEEKPIPGASPARLVRTHALAKGLSAASLVRDGLVISADTVVFFRGRIIGKPRDMKDAVRILGSLQGRWHRVYTGVALVRVDGGKAAGRRVFTEMTRVRLRPMDAAAIRRYFRRVNPLDKAGAYAIQSSRPAVVAEVKGSFSNAVGLPVESLMRDLRRHG